LDPVGDAVAFPKSIEFWKDRRISDSDHTLSMQPAEAAAAAAPQLRRSESTVENGRVKTIGGVFAAGVASLLDGSVTVRQRLVRMSECDKTAQALQDDKSESRDIIDDVLQLHLRKNKDTDELEPIPTVLYYLRDFRKFIFAKRMGGQYRDKEVTAVDLGDKAQADRFLAEIKVEWKTIAKYYELDPSMQATARACITKLELYTSDIESTYLCHGAGTA
jgi:hypothetical protein